MDTKGIGQLVDSGSPTRENANACRLARRLESANIPASSFLPSEGTNKKLQKCGLWLHELMLLAKSQIVLTDRSKHIRNKAIRKCDRLKLDGMDTFVTIIENPLVFSRPCDWSDSSISGVEPLF